MAASALPVEAALTNYLMNKAGRLGLPMNGTFELSPLCNFACKMCYVRKTPREVREHDRPMMQKEQWLSLAKTARDAGLLYLLITGGEPFLHPDFWEIYETVVNMGILVSINTNGSLIDGAAVERLKKRPPSRVNITLYGASDETYEALCGAKGVFTRVTDAIRMLRQAGIQVKLNCSLTPHNCGDLAKMAAFAARLDAPFSLNAYMFPPMRRDASMVGQNDRFTPEQAGFWTVEEKRLRLSPEAFLRYAESVVSGYVDPPGLDESCVDPQDGKIHCRAGKSCFWVTWDGWFSACGMMLEPRVDLYENSFEGCWQKLREACAPIRLSGVCEKCPNLALCHSCAAVAAAETGTFGGIPRYLCRMSDAMKKTAQAHLDRLRAEKM